MGTITLISQKKEIKIYSVKWNYSATVHNNNTFIIEQNYFLGDQLNQQAP